jgi:HSP20 family protein
MDDELLDMSRRNPIDEIEQMFERMNRELTTLGEGFDRGFRSDVNVDVIERDEEIVVVADLPGFTAADIDVSLADDELTITAEQDSETEIETDDEEGRYHRRERRTRSVKRRVRLPEDVVEDGTSAEYEHGVLTVTLPTPESEEEDETTIEVE